jgi:histidyl-tRNA synthetase
VGSDSLLNEVELIQMVDEVFHRLNISITIKLNNRKILNGIAQIIGAEEKITDITVAIDKLDKIGLDNVNAELASKGITQAAIKQLQPILLLQGNNAKKLAQLKKVLVTSPIGLQGINELETIFEWLKPLSIQNKVELDLMLARGLNYYTGAIIEVKANDVQIGSISGGGRYDNLTGVFGLENVSGVGISFGADRIYDVLHQLNAFPETSNENTFVLFLNFGSQEQAVAIPLLNKVRQSGINAEIYPEAAKIKKQMNYANQNNISWVVIIGENEINQGVATLKNMQSGEQKIVSQEQIIKYLV